MTRHFRVTGRGSIIFCHFINNEALICSEVHTVKRYPEAGNGNLYQRSICRPYKYSYSIK